MTTKFNNRQMMLASATADNIERFGCNTMEAITVLMELTAGLIGRHAPSEEQLIIVASEVGNAIRSAAGQYFHKSDIYPGR